MNKSKVFVPLTVFAMAFSLVTPVFADFTAENQDTGYNSENEAEAYAETELEVENENTESVVNSGDGQAYTGDNLSDYNTGSGDVDSGLAVVTGGFTNELNINEVEYTEDWGTTFEATNDTTGALSDNDAEAYLEIDIEVDNENEANVANSAIGEGDTGGNSASYNTGDGDVESGNALVGVLEDNLVNDNFSDIALTMDDPTFEATNDTTGADSDNEAEAYVESDIEIDNENEAFLDNVGTAVAYTGDNDADYNTGSGTVDSGDADSDVSIINDVNLSNDSVTIDLGDAEFTAENKKTGYDSENDAEAYAENDVEVDNDNDAEVHNTGYAESDTGGNSTSFNTGSGLVTSGDAGAEVMIDNSGSINENETTVSIDLGDVIASATNDTTGALSDNDAEAYVENEVDVDNDNEATVTNSAISVAYTGDNSADYNTGSGTVESGNAATDVNIENDVNTNVTTIDINPGTELTAENNTTGAESDNDASASIENDINVENENNAFVYNEVISESDTGGNTANYNTGSGSVTSGNATVTFGSTNNVNSNTTTVGGGM